MMLPVIMPAPMVRPPRTSGLSTARVSTRSARTGVGESVLRLCPRAPPVQARGSVSNRGTGRGQRCFIIREIGHFLHVLRVLYGVVLVHHENGAAYDAQFLDQGAILAAERAVLMVRKHLDLVDSESSAPAFLGEGQIHADGEDVHVG